MKKSEKKLPEGWRWVKLADIAAFKNGINFNKSQVGSGVLILDVLNMYSESIYPKLDSLYRVNASLSEEYVLKPEDLLFVRSSVKKEGVGWPTVFQGFTEPISFCGFIIRARLIEPNISPKYLVHYFRQNSVRKNFISASGQTTITNISQTNLKKVLVPLPPTLDNQIAIANELERKMTEVEKMQQAALRQQEAVAAMRNAILREVFLSLKHKQHQLTSISEIAHVIMGQSPDGSTYNKEGKGTPLLNGPTEFGTEHPIPLQWTTSPTKFCDVGDLIICVRGNTTGKMNWADQMYCLGRGVAVIRGKPEKGDIHFIRYALEYKITALLTGSERSTFPNIGKDDLSSFEIAVPESISVQEKIVVRIKEKLENVKKIDGAVHSQVEAIDALPGAFLREVFDFEKE